MGPQHHCCGMSMDITSAFFPCTASMGPQHHCCGMPNVLSTPHRYLLASMGPQHHCCGMVLEPTATGRCGFCFNGAATSLLRNAHAEEFRRMIGICFNGAATSLLRNEWQKDGRRSGYWKCFNGAATSLLRNVDLAQYILIQKQQLQWGRNITAAEWATNDSVSLNIKGLQWGRNITAAEC